MDIHLLINSQTHKKNGRWLKSIKSEVERKSYNQNYKIQKIIRDYNEHLSGATL